MANNDKDLSNENLENNLNANQNGAVVNPILSQYVNNEADDNNQVLPGLDDMNQTNSNMIDPTGMNYMQDSGNMNMGYAQDPINMNMNYTQDQSMNMNYVQDPTNMNYMQDQSNANMNYTQNNDLNGSDNSQVLPEMQNFAGQNSIGNEGQSVFLDQQGFEQFNYGDQTAYNEQNMQSFGDPMQNNMMNNNADQSQGFDNQSYNPQDSNAFGMDNMSPMGGLDSLNSMNQTTGFDVMNNSNPMGGFDQYSNNSAGNMQYGAQQYDNNQSAQNGYGSNQYSSDNSDYNLAFVQNWMGSLYEKAHSKKFNWCAALFGEGYLMYRKMYSTGIILLIVTALISVIASLLNSTVSTIILLIFFIAKFVGLGLGFYPLYRSNVRNALNKYKQQIQDNDQLVEKARLAGGTSVIGIVIYIVALMIISIVSSVMMISKGSTKQKTPTVTNQVPEVETNIQQAVFETGYSIDYDGDTWFYTGSTKSFSDGNLKLGYIIKYDASQIGVDFNSTDGRTAVLTMLVDSFTSQASQSNLQVESANSTFIAKYDAYYAYIDVISTTSISRYYFIILPDDNSLFQFVLEVNDTAIDYTTNLDIIDMLTQITLLDTDDVYDNNLANTTNETTTTGDGISGSTGSGNVTTSSSTENGITTETNTTGSDTTVSNTVSSALSNTTSSNSGTTTSQTQSSNSTSANSQTNRTSSSLSELMQ